MGRNCKPICALCRNLVISQAVTFTGGNLIINIPQNSYRDGSKYCIVVAQTVPSTTTRDALVYITIGSNTTLYPLTNRCCAQLTQESINSRTKYSTIVSTNATGGSFKLIGNNCCSCRCQNRNRLESIDGTTPATPATPAT